MIKWYFPYSGNLNKRGLSDPGVETFRGELLESLSREIIQNSLDAKLPEKEIVNIEFDYFSVETNEFPDKDSFVVYLNKSYKEGKRLKDKKTSNFFENAIKLFNNSSIDFVRISDYNTTGLTGSKEKHSSNWNNLVKSTGISDKGSSDGGSFGIGKNAPFACSDLYTVFYSTLDKHGIEAFQGVANLISVYKDDESDYTQGIGQLSESEDLRPIHKQFKIQQGFNRTSSGTDIYIPAIKFDKNDFKDGIIKGVLNNFLYAIFKETLVVKVNDILINKSNMQEILLMYKSQLNIETVELYEILTSKSTRWYSDFDNGEVLLGIALSAGGSRKVSAIRKPWMKITSLSGFSRGIEFIGAFIVVGEKLNKLFRKMENPQHDKWEVDRLEKGLKKLGVNTLRDMRKYINDKVTGLIEINLDEQQELYGAEEYIQLVDDDKKGKGRVKESISSVQTKKTNTIINPQSSYDYGLTDAIVDADGEIPVFESIVKEEERELIMDQNPNKPTIQKGKIIKINKNQLKVYKNTENSYYHLYYKSQNESNYVHFKIHPLDEEGNKIQGLLEIADASRGTKKLEFYSNEIVNIKLESSICNIKFRINLKESLSLGVDVYESS